MKTINVIGMSVVAAGLLLTGCGSSSSSSTSTSTSGVSGDAVIKSLKAPMDMTDQNVTEVLNFVRDQFRQFGGVPKVAAAFKANFKAVQDANFAVAAGEPEPCEISGTVTYTSNYTEDATGYRDEWGYVYDNCVETAEGGIIDDIPLNIVTRDGSESMWYAYSSDGNLSTNTYGGADNYTEVYENNETQTVSRTNTYQNSSEFGYESSETHYKYTNMQDGMSMQEDVNSSGDTIPVWKEVAENFSAEQYQLRDNSAGSLAANGGMSYYSEGTAQEGVYFDTYLYEWTRMNQEKTVVINGTAGSLCLGGSVSAQTTTAMKENQVDYFDDSNNTGSDVLPYAGSISLTGADSVTATVGFDTNDTNHTSATVTIGDAEPQTFTSWSAMTEGSTCRIIVPIMD